MIDLQSIRKMAKATENGKHYTNPMKNKSEGGSRGSRYNSLVATSRKAGVKLSGSLKTKAGFLEAHNRWLFYSVDVFSDLLKEHEAILDLVSIARVKEIQESFRSFAENNSVMKQIPASQLDREVLKQQYFNSLKGNQS